MYLKQFMFYRISVQFCRISKIKKIKLRVLLVHAPHFAGEETKIQKGEMTHPRSHCWSLMASLTAIWNV